MKSENPAVVEAYLSALRDKDFSKAPVADDIRFENPLSGPGSGRADLDAFLAGFLPAINDIRIRRNVCEGEFVATHWDADSVFGIIQVLEMFRVENGKIKETVALFDPRPIVGGT
jgi:limonene-1,2-epoxide hydrolase